MWLVPLGLGEVSNCIKRKRLAQHKGWLLSASRLTILPVSWFHNSPKIGCVFNCEPKLTCPKVTFVRHFVKVTRQVTNTWEEVDTDTHSHVLLKDTVPIRIFSKWSWLKITCKPKSLHKCLTSALSSSFPKIYHSSYGMEGSKGTSSGEFGDSMSFWGEVPVTTGILIKTSQESGRVWEELAGVGKE